MSEKVGSLAILPQDATTTLPNDTSLQGKLAKLRPFVFYQPVHPVTIPKPISEHSRDEVRDLARKHGSKKATGKRPRNDDDDAQDVAGPSAAKRKRGAEATSANAIPTPVVPPTFNASLSSRHVQGGSWLRYAATDCWYHIRACKTPELPDGVSIEDVLTDDANFQNSTPFQECRRPKGAYFRCIPCLREKGIWKTWSGEGSGPGTHRVRGHLDLQHSATYRSKCQAENVVLPELLLSANEDDDEEFSFDLLNTYLAQWAAVDDQAMNVVERYEFRRLLMLCSRGPRLRDSDIPHRTKLTSVTDELYAQEMARIRRELKNSIGHICATTDLWSDDKLRSFMAVTVHYMNAMGELSEHLLAFKRIFGRHTGSNLSRALYNVFEDAGILDKLGHITLDNASNNDTLMIELENMLAQAKHKYGHEAHRIRCFPHVINLAVQAVLESLPTAAQSFQEEASVEGHELDEKTTAYIDAMRSDVLHLVRESITAARRTDIRREGFRNTIIEGNANGQFKTSAGQAIALFAQQNPSFDIPLPSHQQFEVLQDLCLVLSILHHAQQIFSSERTPTLPLALPAYEALIKALTNMTYEFPELRFSIECAVQKLEGYVDKARDLPVYACSMAINPCLKFSWIDENWGPSRRRQARVDMQNAMYNAREKQGQSKPSATSRSQPAAQAQQRGFMRLLTLSTSVRRASDSVDGAPVSKAPTKPAPPSLSADELMLVYLREAEAELLRWEQYEWAGDEIMGTLDLVEFWKAHKHVFPLLHQVAMNVLPVQASSVSSERAFSSSELTCTRERNNISAEHMEHLQVLKHSLHRRRATAENHQTLDFMVHVVGEDNDDPEDG